VAQKRHQDSDTCATNGLFAAFIMAGLGSGLSHAWAVQARASGATHLLIAIPGAAICAIVLYRYARHWPARVTPLYQKRRRGLLPGAATAAGGALLFVAGLGMALVVAAGSAALLVLAALGLGILPWTRIAVCRDHFFVSAAIVGAGVARGLSQAGPPISQPYYATSALFCLGLSGLMTVFIVMMHGGRRDRMPATGYGWMSD
jgi:hypothetical protein